MNKTKAPNISGVSEEIQQKIIEDLNEQLSEAVRNQLKIGISVSDNEDLKALGYSNIHLRDLTIETARNLLINSMILVYGGDLRKEGYTTIFADLSYQYRSLSNKNKSYINFFAFPIYLQITKQNELDFKKNRVELIRVQPPAHLNLDINQYPIPNNNEAKLVWVDSLTKMRNEMISTTDARILVGGKVNNYLGAMPGIIEEAKITLEKNKPLFLIGAFGGSAKQIINCFTDNGFTFIEDEYHNSAAYKDFNEYYNSLNSDNQINLKSEEKFFQDFGIEKLAHLNGLTIEENLRLFTSPHLTEILYYIFKGLKNIGKRSPKM